MPAFSAWWLVLWTLMAHILYIWFHAMDQASQPPLRRNSKRDMSLQVEPIKVPFHVDIISKTALSCGCILTWRNSTPL
jgi:hypothetical protein